MKKLKLKLAGREMLSKEQMKKISGGYDGNCIGCYPALIECNNPNDPSVPVYGPFSTEYYYGCAYVKAFDEICEGIQSGYEWNGYCDCSC